MSQAAVVPCCMSSAEAEAVLVGVMACVITAGVLLQAWQPD